MIWVRFGWTDVTPGMDWGHAVDGITVFAQRDAWTCGRSWAR